MSDGRHDVSDKALNNLKKVAYKQDDFGVDKYNKPLSHLYNYDWLKMGIEELADCIKYIQCEMDRKEQVINQLKTAIDKSDWDYVKMALYNLCKDGTGK